MSALAFQHLIQIKTILRIMKLLSLKFPFSLPPSKSSFTQAV
ncbi:hypothetical protein PBAL39_15739 [Pedobacter sp. BAL39]|nr:hypothetical protein PBAL39_15739 [Pedobacter sp. BAL39]